MTVNRYTIEDAIERWRDEAVAAGLDAFHISALYDPNWTKDLARDILVAVREADLADG